MYKTSKKITASGFLFLLALPLLLSLFIVIRQKAIQHEAHERLEKTLLQKITLPLDKLHWVEKEREVLIDGKLFDVKSYQVFGNQVQLTGLFDIAETELAKQLTGMMEHEDGDGSLFNQAVLKLLILPLYFSPDNVEVNKQSDLISSFYFPYSEPLTDAPVHALNQPPRV